MTVAAIEPDRDWKNLFGVCACLGEDFGFNPLWLRIGFGAALIYAPVAVIATYVGLGAAVLVSRLAAPDRRRAAPAAVAPVAMVEEEPLALAA